MPASSSFAIVHVADVVSGGGDDLALGVQRVLGERAGVDRVLDVLVADQGTLVVLRRDAQLEALGRAAVVFADDDILRDVDETTREVPGVGGTQSGVGQALAGTVGGDEVLGHRQSLAVRGDDRTRDGLTLRVRHQATDTGDVAHLQPVASSTRRHHPVDVVVLREGLLHRGGDLVGGLRPDVDQLTTARTVVDQTLVELALHLGGALLVPSDDLALVLRGEDVGQRDGHTGARGPVETGVLDAVERRGDLDLGVALGEVVDDRRDLALVGDGLDVRVVGRQRLVEERAAERRRDERGAARLVSPRAPRPRRSTRPRDGCAPGRSGRATPGPSRGSPRRRTRTHGPHRSHPP